MGRIRKIKEQNNKCACHAMRHARKELNISRKQFGEMFGFTKREIQNFEYGRVRIPDGIISKIIVAGLKDILSGK